MIASHTCASASDDVVMFRNVHIGHMQYIVQSLHSKVRFGEMTRRLLPMTLTRRLFYKKTKTDRQVSVIVLRRILITLAQNLE